MSSKVPISRPIAWISLIPQLLFLAVLYYIYYLFAYPEFVILAPLTFIIISISLRCFVAKAHRQGMKLLKQAKFSEAITAFEKSLDYFTRHKWIDKYRFITVLSSSKMTYAEMAMCNIAFCYGQTGDIQESKRYYEIVLERYPGNVIAKTALNMIKSINKQHNSGEH